MKKGIIVLLIAVLVAGFAFASFSGSASVGFDFNLSTKENGLFNKKAMKYSFTFDIEKAIGESTGEGDIYAEIAATADFVIKANGLTSTAEVAPKATLKIKKANIIIKDVTINILGPDGPYDYAASYYAYKDGTPVEDFANVHDVAPGFTVSYKDFSVAFAYRHYAAKAAGKPVYGWKNGSDPSVAPTWAIITPATPATPEYTDLYAGLQTPAFELADGLTLQAAGNFGLTQVKDADADIWAGGGVAVAYANEDAKLDVTLAADAEYNNEELLADVSLGASYDFVSLDVYYGTGDTFETSCLSAKLSAAYTFEEALTVSAYGESRHILELEKPAYLFGAGVKYAAEKFTAYANADFRMAFITADDAYGFKNGSLENTSKVPGIGVSAGISSTALISNCKVALDWTGSDFSVKKDDKLSQLGVIAVSATVAF